jgi:acyl-coenzyme A thioesterase PaaI-like protein
MIDPEHYRKLERLYANAPVTRWFGSSVEIADGRADIRIPVKPEFLHAAHAVHGSIYFRALDDAAFFAAGMLHAAGVVLSESGRLFTAESKLFDDSGQLLGHGSGVFTRSAIKLDRSVGYV